MNKKGFTMTELIVSIAIIAVVMIFLVNLLVDIRYDKKNELYDTKNQINRAEIIKTIQNDLDGKIIKDITDDTEIDSTDTGSDSNNLVVNIITDDDDNSKHIIKADSNHIYYISNNKITKWSLEKNNDETYIKTSDVKLKVIKCSKTEDPKLKTENPKLKTDDSKIKCDSNDKIIIINIPIIVDKSKLRENNDSQMDNIILTFYNYSSFSIEDKILNSRT